METRASVLPRKTDRCIIARDFPQSVPCRWACLLTQRGFLGVRDGTNC